MIQMIPYLTFNGNCREAMKFYQRCLGGELKIQTVRDSPESDLLPNHMKDFILQASLESENLYLMGTDMTDGEVIRGNSVSLLLNCLDEDRAKRYYKKLEAGGNRLHPLEKTYWGDFFGGLTDKYGHHWLFRCKKSVNRKYYFYEK